MAICFYSVFASFCQRINLSDQINQISGVDIHKFRFFSARIVASVPGRHTGLAKSKWGHLRLRNVSLRVVLEFLTRYVFVCSNNTKLGFAFKKY